MSSPARPEAHSKPDRPGFKSSASSRLPKLVDTQPALYKSRSALSSPSRRQRNSLGTFSLPPSPKVTPLANKETPSTPSKVRNYSPLTPSASVSSFGTGSFTFHTPRTPPKSPRFITPLPSPPSIKFPHRSSPTLAMSIQVHPAIIHSPSAVYHPSPSYPDPSNNLRSRSEKMLRETLRRADERDRAIASPFFLPTPLKEDDDSDCDCEDLDGFFGHRVGSPRPRLTRNNSIDKKRSVSPIPHGSSRRTSTTSSSSDDVFTPHEAVLRRRLEGVLSQVRDQDRGKSHRSVSRPRAHTRESSEDWNSQSSSPLPAYSPGLPTQSLVPLTPPPTPPHAPSILSRTVSHPGNTGRRPPKSPSSPPFDARTASAMCRRMDGYVSFANIEGLGSPPEDDMEAVDAGRNHAWLKWLGLKQAAGVEGVARA